MTELMTADAGKAADLSVETLFFFFLNPDASSTLTDLDE